jgi:hypothetical protein
VLAVARWPDARFERPWLVANPGQVPDLVALLRRLGQAHAVTVALEPSGTYGDPVRQALTDAGLGAQRVMRRKGRRKGVMEEKRCQRRKGVRNLFACSIRRALKVI